VRDEADSRALVEAIDVLIATMRDDPGDCTSPTPASYVDWLLL
jgi:hypothetical protein